ncbi:MAG TPA: hypothetical protein VFH56_05875 [Acidimicrobiales bacterium]|nr:hypothetical protein [Acidimicrobiales bacterium]
MGAVDSVWGEWLLGDLADTLAELSDLLGKSTQVTWVSVKPPTAAGSDPRVFISVPHHGDLPRLHDELAGCGRPVEFVAPGTCGWFAALPGLARLHVEADQ